MGVIPKLKKNQKFVLLTKILVILDIDYRVPRVKNSMSTKSSDKVPLLEMLLFGGLIIMLLTSALRWNMADKESRSTRTQTTANLGANQLVANPPSSQSQAQPQTQPQTQPQAQVQAPTPTQVQVGGTHRVLCATGDAGLNFRSQAGFSQPLFVVPCGSIVTVTGSPVAVQNETWSPVTYANRSGWSATKLLQPIR
jgi:hypothetical protein